MATSRRYHPFPAIADNETLIGLFALFAEVNLRLVVVVGRLSCSQLLDSWVFGIAPFGRLLVPGSPR